ncbi:riboflavin synthase [Neolewinella antarctica]|uniref:Riboflavin synthase n=1 Tax=Neolewinella antarctica TaxID=442734 RepID=A0ABX0X7N0_9BACT|nr:riboflavin synthase [Neolewinella antarctica]NJC25055.1 riboflavin synthase [Neolewinella antarctica]
MFTGIIESNGTITNIEREHDNVHFTVRSTISDQLKIDQSLAHDGVCLTVVALDRDTHTVTAIRETMDRTRLGEWRDGDTVNLERAMQAGARLDGHIVQGHVDTVGECLNVEEAGGSWYFTFRYAPTPEHLLVDKGSVTINGVSLTVVEPTDETFKVAIIPYTYEHTNFRELAPGSQVNLEFDIIGKYIARQMAAYQAHALKNG